MSDGTRTFVGQWLLQATARLLERHERDAVLGDLMETGASPWQGISEILGLVIRREIALWYDWRPWIAAFGVALPGSFLLMGVSLSVSCTYLRLTGTAVSGVCAPTGPEGFLLLACQALLLLIWAWTSGFFVGSVSRRTLWVSVAVCVSPCLFCLARFPLSCVSGLCLLLFLPPAMLGVRYGLRKMRMSPGAALTVAMSATALMIYTWNNSALWILHWALILPAWASAILARSSDRGAGA
ncbi:MAG TPA: hypothetical protein VI653_08070 [Steroidobacteraceae bacterium]